MWRMSFLLVGYSYIFCVVSLCLDSYVRPPLQGDTTEIRPGKVMRMTDFPPYVMD